MLPRQHPQLQIPKETVTVLSISKRFFLLLLDSLGEVLTPRCPPLPGLIYTCLAYAKLDVFPRGASFPAKILSTTPLSTYFLLWASQENR